MRQCMLMGSITGTGLGARVCCPPRVQNRRHTAFNALRLPTTNEKYAVVIIFAMMPHVCPQSGGLEIDGDNPQSGGPEIAGNS